MTRIRTAILAALAILLLLGVASCGSGGEGGNGGPAPSISITVPTSDSSYSTTQTGVNIGGTISNASFVHVRNALTGSTTEGYVNYNEGYGSWFAELYGLGFGNNPITVTADAYGNGAKTAVAHITVIRPLQPADLIINGPNQASTFSFWTDANSFAKSYKIAFFGDGTGRSTTGSTLLPQNAGPVVDFTWSMAGPDLIAITNCLNCSFQNISRISGSLSEGLFFGQVETVGNVGYLALDGFNLTSGNL